MHIYILFSIHPAGGAHALLAFALGKRDAAE
jgi:hypothetical protein